MLPINNFQTYEKPLASIEGETEPEIKLFSPQRCPDEKIIDVKPDQLKPSTIFGKLNESPYKIS